MAVASELEGPSRRQFMESVFPDSHRVLLSWSGLIHRSPDSSRLPSSLMLPLSMTLLRVMAVPTGFGSPTASHHRAPWMHRAERCSAGKCFPGDTVGPRPSPSPSHPRATHPVLATARGACLPPSLRYRSVGPSANQGPVPPSSICPACSVLYTQHLSDFEARRCGQSTPGGWCRMCCLQMT